VDERRAEKRLFLRRTVPVLLCSALLALLGVLAVDLYIEYRQVDGSTQVANKTISTSRLVGELGGSVARYEEAVAYTAPNEASSVAALRRVRDRLVLAMTEFEPYVDRADRSTWEGLRESIGAAPLEPGMPATATHDQVRALDYDLAATASIVDRSGLADMGSAERLHTLHGILEACVIFLMTGVSLVILFNWSRQEPH
jgi:hypothetical protein